MSAQESVGRSALLRRGLGWMSAWGIRAASSGTFWTPSCLPLVRGTGWLPAQLLPCGMSCAEIGRFHVDATEGGVSFDISLAVEVRSISPGL